MSRKLFAFLLSELKTVRIICPHCGSVSEVALDQIDARFGGAVCHFCTNNLGFSEHQNHLVALAKAIANLQEIQKKAAGMAIEVEFVLPGDCESGPFPT